MGHTGDFLLTVLVVFCLIAAATTLFLSLMYGAILLFLAALTWAAAAMVTLILQHKLYG